MAMKIYDAFETKEQAQALVKDLKEQGVEKVQVKRINMGRLKYGVYLGGKNSGDYV